MIIDNELAVIIFRGADRLLISIGGVISIWLGYKLFNKALPNNGSFDGGIGSWSVRMQNIAPGVFFALFGASALIFSITHPLAYEKENIVDVVPREEVSRETASNNDVLSQQGQSRSSFSGFGADSAPNLEAKNDFEILNALAIVNIYKNKNVDGLTIEQIKKINDSYTRLFVFQITLINKMFGVGSFDKYQAISSDIRQDPSLIKKYSQEDQMLYQSIKPIFVQ
ncbi:TPA: hypothetical protein U2R14_003553 [Raoultella planticola]|uniref:hypothetical protein n=1 Tax=Raoultella planticola TaxID=575 RepID=UPI002AB39B96|nr:hypothetical protein [Raoultella planticola]